MQTMSIRALPHSPRRQRSSTSARHRAGIDECLEVGIALALAGPAGEENADVFGALVVEEEGPETW
jgi:hypothetical protein